MKKMLIGSDKSGFELKEAVKAHLIELGYEVEDCGTTDPEKAMAYYEVAPVGAKKVSDGAYEKAILICGTGMGMAVVANKFPGVYAAVCENTYAAEKARAINNANVLTMGGWITGTVVGCEIVDKFLNTEFLQGLEDWRQKNLIKAFDVVKSIEKDIYHK